LNVRRVYSVLLIVCFVILGQLAFSQSTGSIGGTVTDSVGSTVVNADVTVRNQATGEAHTTKTDASGIYLVPSLPVGTYRVEVKSPGMQTTAATGVELSVGSTVRQDFSLQVSATSTTVEVSGDAFCDHACTIHTTDHAPSGAGRCGAGSPGAATATSGWNVASWRRRMAATLPGSVRSSCTDAVPASCTAP